MPFTGTNNIINSINSCSPFCPLCLRCVAIHRCRCRIWNLSCGAARCLFTFLLPLSPSYRWRFYNLSAIEIQQTFLNLFAWLHFGRAFSQRASAERGGGGGGISVSWLPPAGTFCICLQHSSIALAAARCCCSCCRCRCILPPWRCPPGTHCFDFYPQREYANCQA